MDLLEILSVYFILKNTSNILIQGLLFLQLIYLLDKINLSLHDREFQPNKNLLFIPYVIKTISGQWGVWHLVLLCSFLLHLPHFYMHETIWESALGKYTIKMLYGKERERWGKRKEKEESLDLEWDKSSSPRYFLEPVLSPLKFEAQGSQLTSIYVLRIKRFYQFPPNFHKVFVPSFLGLRI